MEIACYVSLSQDLPVAWLYWDIVKGITEPIVLILFSAIFHTGLCDILSDLLVSLILSFRKSCREVWGCAWCSAGIGSQLYMLFSWSTHNVVTQRMGNSSFAEQVAQQYSMYAVDIPGMCQTHCIWTTQPVRTYSNCDHLIRIYDVQEVDGSSQESREVAEKTIPGWKGICARDCSMITLA